MATKPLPPNSCNFAINAPRAWRLEVGKIAHDLGLSVGEYLRRAAEAYSPSPETRRRLVEIRNNAAKGFVCVALLAGFGLQLATRAGDAVRGASSVRVVRTLKGGRRLDGFMGEEAFAA